MKLTLEGIKDKAAWKGYHLPEYDIEKMCEETRKNPVWMHFGSGNIFRAFLCSAAQSLLESGDMKVGITAAESHGTEIITECFKPHDNLCVAVTLNSDGSTDKDVIASVGEAVTTELDFERIEEIFCEPGLQMVSFTITEKGYALKDADGHYFEQVLKDMRISPKELLEECRGKGKPAHHLMAIITALCLERYVAAKAPLALVSMDNCSRNGEKIEQAVSAIAEAWHMCGKVTDEELKYLKESISYPWSMIDKITPRPDAKVEAGLIADGIDEIKPFVTPNGTYIAAFVNAERPQYLVIEDDFPNGRPALDKARGIIFADRDTVNKTERMKVCTCLNPLHTALAIYGCLLGHTSISEEMKDKELSTLIRRMSAIEGMPVVVDPGIINPQSFLEECLNERFPNPFMPDTPQRIATDTSQKLPIRYGENFKAHVEKGDADKLVYMPLVIAGWLRYLLGIDDNGEQFTQSSDPMLLTCRNMLKDIEFGRTDVKETELSTLLSNEVIFGLNLVQAGFAPLITRYFNELNAGKGAIRETLKKYTA